MKQKKTDSNQFTQQETQLIEQLRGHPEMVVRVQSILAIARNAEGPLKSADEVEELLIEEMRRLGNVTLRQWAIQAEVVLGPNPDINGFCVVGCQAVASAMPDDAPVANVILFVAETCIFRWFLRPSLRLPSSHAAFRPRHGRLRLPRSRKEWISSRADCRQRHILRGFEVVWSSYTFLSQSNRWNRSTINHKLTPGDGRSSIRCEKGYEFCNLDWPDHI